MAYSFTKPPTASTDDDDDDDEEVAPNPPIMVPLADILNHISKNNAQLEFKKDFLNMVATRSIKQVRDFCLISLTLIEELVLT